MSHQPHHPLSGTPSSHVWNPTCIWYPITFLKPHHFSGIPSLFWNPITFLEPHHLYGIKSPVWYPTSVPTPTIFPSVATPDLTLVVLSGL